MIEKITGKKADKIVERAIKTIESLSSSRMIQSIGEMIDARAKKLIREDIVKNQLLIQLRALLYVLKKNQEVQNSGSSGTDKKTGMKMRPE